MVKAQAKDLYVDVFGEDQAVDDELRGFSRNQLQKQVQKDPFLARILHMDPKREVRHHYCTASRACCEGLFCSGELSNEGSHGEAGC